MLQTCALLSFPKPGQAKYRFGNPSRAQLNSLFRQRDAKPIDALILQTARALNRAMTIGIRLYGGQDLYFRAYCSANDLKIVREGFEIDFGPGWTGSVIHRLRRLH